jgi:chemotaxis protein methyltransferase CheR
MSKPQPKRASLAGPPIHSPPHDLHPLDGPGGLPRGFNPPPSSMADPLSPKDFERLADMISGHSGIRLPSGKRLMLEGRLRKRVRALGLPSIAEYCRLLFNDNQLESEFVHLVDAATTNKTDFFREPQHFDYLRREIVPSLLANRRPHTGHLLKIWSAASSIGAEAYSIAMLLADMSQGMSLFRFAILGTDLSTEVLEQARRAVYPVEMVEPVPPEMQMRYLMRGRSAGGRGEVRIVPELRRVCRFVHLNLMDTSYPFDRDVDVIFLRNVLIYFDKPNQDAVIARLCGHLRPGGYFLLGHSESMMGATPSLKQVAPAVFQRS